MKSYAFDDAVRVGRVEHITLGDRAVRRYHVDVQQRFFAGGAPFGGIILASVLNCLVKDFGDPSNDISFGSGGPSSGPRWPDPLALQATFLSISRAGPAYVDVRRLKEGGRSAVAEAVLRQDQPKKTGGKQGAFETVDILCVVATFGDLSAEEGPDHVTERRPPLEFNADAVEWKPSPEQPGVGMQDLTERVTVLPDLVPTAPGNLPQPLVYHASRFRDGRPTDLVSLAFWADMFNSPVRRIPEIQGRGFRGMTMDLSLQFRGVPKGELVYTRVWTRHLTRGRYDCTCELWDEEGKIVAMGTQTRMMRGLTGGWKIVSPAKGSL
ncbi:thioesterase-like superfamily-domain-containing protein [Hyaloraphidium curvatum]|nr:thioesterase-like superfamily-domain-containing protein [Hyaloraphidium curvatum]